MPEEPRGGGPVRPPRFRATGQRKGGWPCAKPPEAADRLKERQIRRREHITTAQREEQVALGGPGPDTMERVQRVNGLRIGQRVDPVEVELPRFELTGERGEVRRFLPGHADPAETRLTKRRDRHGRDRAGGRYDACVHGAGLRQGDLLFEHEEHQRLEAGLARPERRQAVAGHDPREARLRAAQPADRRGKQALIERSPSGDTHNTQRYWYPCYSQAEVAQW